MTKPKTDRVKYTLEFKLEAVRLVDTGLTLAAAARSLAGYIRPDLVQLGQGASPRQADRR